MSNMLDKSPAKRQKPVHQSDDNDDSLLTHHVTPDTAQITIKVEPQDLVFDDTQLKDLEQEQNEEQEQSDFEAEEEQNDCEDDDVQEQSDYGAEEEHEQQEQDGCEKQWHGNVKAESERVQEPTRRRVIYSQLVQLWQFLDTRRDLATGNNKTSQAREFSRRMWKEIAPALNSHGDCAVKDWKGWCKYWNDYKSKLKKSAAKIKSSRHGLTDIEKKFLQILKYKSRNVPPVKLESLEDGGLTQLTATTPQPQQNQYLQHPQTLNTSYPTPSSSLTQFPNPSPQTPLTPQPIQNTPPPYSPIQIGPMTSSHIQIGPTTSSHIQIGPTTSSHIQIGPSTSSHIGQTSFSSIQIGPNTTELNQSEQITSSPIQIGPASSPECTQTPKERRRRRQQSSMSIEKARRALVLETQKQTKIQEEKLRLFDVLIREIRELKEILRTRANDRPARDGL